MTEQKQTYSKDNPSYNEKELLQRIAKDDSEAYAKLFDQYSKHIYTLAIKFTKDTALAEDLTQEIFISLWLNRHKLAKVYHFKGYINTIAKNLLRNYLKKKVWIPENDHFYINYFSEASGGQNKLEFKEMQSAINKAIQTLPPQLKKVFVLSRIEGLSHEEIAKKLQISRISVKSYIVRSLIVIREYLSKYYPLYLFTGTIILGVQIFF